MNDDNTILPSHEPSSSEQVSGDGIEGELQVLPHIPKEGVAYLCSDCDKTTELGHECNLKVLEANDLDLLIQYQEQYREMRHDPTISIKDVFKFQYKIRDDLSIYLPCIPVNVVIPWGKEESRPSYPQERLLGFVEQLIIVLSFRQMCWDLSVSTEELDTFLAKYDYYFAFPIYFIHGSASWDRFDPDTNEYYKDDVNITCYMERFYMAIIRYTYKHQFESIVQILDNHNFYMIIVKDIPNYKCIPTNILHLFQAYKDTADTLEALDNKRYKDNGTQINDIDVS